MRGKRQLDSRAKREKQRPAGTPRSALNTANAHAEPQVPTIGWQWRQPTTDGHGPSPEVWVADAKTRQREESRGTDKSRPHGGMP